MKKKLRIGILFGGRSGEHEVSLLSAASILKNIDRRRYDVVPVGINKQGRWLGIGESQALLAGEAGRVQPLEAPAGTAPLQLLELNAGADQRLEHETPRLGRQLGSQSAFDVLFPVLHGTFGEDGTMQGLFELADIAYVGSGVLGSATGMDKGVMKQLFAAAGLTQTPYLVVLRKEWKADPRRLTKSIERRLAYPIFVKPANLGSSVGISKVHDRGELAPAMELAAGFDRRIIIEQGVGGAGAKPRELEIAVLGNDDPEASVIGEIVPGAEFYDYDAKYHSSASTAIIPAKLSASEAKQLRTMALAAFRACDCAGLARVDFLMERARKGAKPRIYINEINTMPGFTEISMYPKLWQASGISYKKLIDRLIVLAGERHGEKHQTQFAVNEPAALAGRAP